MALLNKDNYQKKKPFRDATIFIIVCEGSNAEPKYFDFFDKLSPRIKVHSIPSIKGKSAPNHLVNNASDSIEKYNSDQGKVELWIVLDIDKWLEHRHIYNVQKKVAQTPDWHLAISNPCFEVWLSFHFTSHQPQENKDKCKVWKDYVNSLQSGGFNPKSHPTLLQTAISQSRENYSGSGFIPDPGSTQVYLLGERIQLHVGKILEQYV